MRILPISSDEISWPLNYKGWFIIMYRYVSLTVIDWCWDYS